MSGLVAVLRSEWSPPQRSDSAIQADGLTDPHIACL